jgi:hypothetical protein
MPTGKTLYQFIRSILHNLYYIRIDFYTSGMTTTVVVLDTKTVDSVLAIGRGSLTIFLKGPF